MTYAQPQADPTQVVGRRIGAYAIDTVIMAAIIVAIVYPLFMSASQTVPSQGNTCTESGFEFEDEPTGDRSVDSAICFELGDEIRFIPEEDSSGFAAQAYGIMFGISALNLVVLQGLTGASLGKLAVGLRVIRKDGRKAGIGWAALRWVLLYVDSFCCFMPGIILVFVTKGHRRLGDMAASTFVVRSGDVGTPPQVPGVTTPVTWPGAQPGYGGGYQGQGQGQGWPAGPSVPAGWSPPAQGSGTWAPQGDPPAASAPSGDGPTWDPARNAYIQYDQGQSAWVQWNDDTKAWGPIDQ